MKDRITIYEEKIKDINRIRILANSKLLFKPYKIRDNDKQILLQFGDVPVKKIAKSLKCNRSYVYATIEKFKGIFTSKEVTVYGK